MRPNNTHNMGFDLQNDSFSGKCKRFNKEATITVTSVGSKLSKTDLERTYRSKVSKCSLLENSPEKNFSACMEDCPLVPIKFI